MDRRRIDMQILARNELFAGADPEAVAAAYDVAREQSFAEGETMFEQGAATGRTGSSWRW